jgi:hypothetical protein
MHHRKHMSRVHYLLLCDDAADMENTASSIVAYWTVFTELSPGNALIKSVTIYDLLTTVDMTKSSARSADDGHA